MVATAVAVAQTEATHTLAQGSIIDFVSDDAVNPQSVRIGGHFKVHTKRDLVVDGDLIAPAGTTARLVVTDKNTNPDGIIMLTVAIDHFRTTPGDLPVSPEHAMVQSIIVGTEIPSRTMGSVDRVGQRLVIRVPLPFSLSNDAPNAFYTPVAARTPTGRFASPRARRATPSPSPAASGSPGAPGSSSPATPAAGTSPTPAPSPAGSPSPAPIPTPK